MVIVSPEDFKKGIGEAIRSFESISPDVLEQLKMLIKRYDLSENEFERTVNAKKILNYEQDLSKISGTCLMLEWELLPHLNNQLVLKKTLSDEQRNAIEIQQKVLNDLTDKIIRLFNFKPGDKRVLFEVTSKISSIKRDAKRKPVDFEIQKNPDSIAKVLTGLLREINVTAGKKKDMSEAIFNIFKKIGYMAEFQISASTPQNIATILRDMLPDINKVIEVLLNKDFMKEIPELIMLKNSLELEWNSFVDSVFAFMQKKALTTIGQKAEFPMPERKQFKELQL
jgi:DNA-binding transcriptional regulator GbsR (MarR family)